MSYVNNTSYVNNMRYVNNCLKSLLFCFKEIWNYLFIYMDGKPRL